VQFTKEGRAVISSVVLIFQPVILFNLFMIRSVNTIPVAKPKYMPVAFC